MLRKQREDGQERAGAEPDSIEEANLFAKAMQKGPRSRDEHLRGPTITNQASTDDDWTDMMDED